MITEALHYPDTQLPIMVGDKIVGIGELDTVSVEGKRGEVISFYLHPYEKYIKVRWFDPNIHEWAVFSENIKKE